jgi:CBS domain-containing membrane protein
VLNPGRRVIGMVTRGDFLRNVVSARAEQALVELLPLMSDRGLHQVPVVDEAGKLVGVISQDDMVAALFELGLQ